MYTSQLKDLGEAADLLQAVRTCHAENTDIDDHYDCREDVKTAFQIIRKVLDETDKRTFSDEALNTLTTLRNATWLEDDLDIENACEEVAKKLRGDYNG